MNNTKRPHRRLPTVIHAHWHVTVRGAVFPVSEAYQRLEEMFLALEIPEVRIGPVRFKEGDFFTRKRGYIRIAYRTLSYDICVCPFGTSTFVSSWLGNRSRSFLVNLFSSLPLLGYVVRRKQEMKTYYQNDSLLTFMDVVHSTLLDWVDEATTSHGIKPIDNSLRKPVMKSLLKGFPESPDWGTRWDRVEKTQDDSKKIPIIPKNESVTWFDKEK